MRIPLISSVLIYHIHIPPISCIKVPISYVCINIKSFDILVHALPQECLSENKTLACDIYR